MNGPLHSVYQSSVVGDSPSAPSITAAPQPAPRTTVTRPVTLGVLREASGGSSSGNKRGTAPSQSTVPCRTVASSSALVPVTQRVPITQRIKEPEVPARLKQKKKTIAFGVTTNVSQTVEREHSSPSTMPHYQSAAGATSSNTSVRPTTTTAAAAAAGLARVGVARQANAAAAAAAPMAQDENRDPARKGREEEEVGASETRESIARLSARVRELEVREEESRKREAEMGRQFDRLVKIVGKCTQRIEELGGSVVEEGEVEERRGGGGGGRARSEEECVRTRRRLYSDEDEVGASSGRRRKDKGGGGGGLLTNQDTLRALDRQLSSNPILRRAVQDAIDQDKYEHEYGDRRAGAGAETSRRHFADFDEERAPPAAARWKEDAAAALRRERMASPSRAERAAGGGGTRRRADGTPSRRRVTERVMMERVHHFDDDDEEEEGSDEGGRRVYETRDEELFETRYDSDEQKPFRTQYREEFMDDFQSVAQPDKRHGYGVTARRADQTFGEGGGGRREGMLTITEMSDSEESRFEQRRRELRERRLAREARK